MAANDALADFAKKPIGFKIAVFLGVYAVLGFLYWQLYYSGMSDKVAELEVTGNRLQQEHQKLRTRETKYKKLVKQNEQLKEQLLKNRVSLPTSSELPSFYVHLQKQAAASGVTIVKWGRGREVPVSFYVKVPVGISVSGTYYQILQYFKLLSQTDRIITIENLKIGGAKIRNDETVLSASFQASTFRLAGDGGDAELFPGDDAGKKKADKKKKSKVGDARAKREKDVADRMGEKSAEGDKKPTTPAPKAGGDNSKKGVNRLKNPGAGVTP